MVEIPHKYHKHPCFYTIDELFEAKQDMEVRLKRIGTEEEETNDNQVVVLIKNALDYNRPLAMRLIAMMDGKL